MEQVLAVIGAQYGSEGKGVIVNKIADQFNVHVRVGGPNAGHSFNHEGRVFKMQVIPCGWTNPKATVVLGRGMLIDHRQLRKEVNEILDVDPTLLDRLVIDKYAGTLDEKHHHEEGGVDGMMHKNIGSTGEGVGAARIARIRRIKEQYSLVHQSSAFFEHYKYRLHADTPSLIGPENDALLEGTQGSGLSLIHGPWPFVTSTDTNAAQLAADCGVAPHRIRTMLVARTFPIRVAGNSGPLNDELTWEQMSEIIGKPVTPERTTVTLKIRRIGRWDDALFAKSVLLNDPCAIAITFMDYLFPEVEGIDKWNDLPKQVREWVIAFENKWKKPVAFLGTGGPTWAVIERENIKDLMTMRKM